MLVGTLVNAGAVLLGTLIGVAIGDRLSENLRTTVLAGLGLVVLVIGVENALVWHHVTLEVLGGVLLGGLAGEAIGIERWLNVLGARLERLRPAGGRTAQGFVTASLLFCVGPLTILGALRDGLAGDHSILFTKSMLDGFASIALAASLGWGVGLAAITVLVVQGAIVLGAGLLDNVITGEALAALTSAGGVLIIAISLKLLDLKDVRVGNFLPALFFAPALVGIVHAVS
jgi:hypothetical protein